jgi:outer membrane protein insertion porin family
MTSVDLNRNELLIDLNANFRRKVRLSTVWAIAFCGLAFVASGCNSFPKNQQPGWARGQDLGEPPVFVNADEPAPARSPDNDAIINIVIQGNNTIETGAILARIRSQKGRPPSERMIKQDLQALHDTNWFYTVERRYRMTEDGLLLIFKVVERPIVKSVKVIGNESIRDRIILKTIAIEKGSPYNVATNRAAARRLQRFYRDKKSFPDATVTLSSGDKPDDRDVIIEIDEGLRTVVTDIRFLGNEEISSTALKGVVRTKKAVLFGMIGGKFDESKSDDDIAALKQYYQALGFFDIEVVKETKIEENNFHIIPKNQYVRRVDAKAAHVFTINEGMRYKIRKIETIGNEIFADDDLLKESQLAEGDFFNARFLNRDVEGMKTRYGELGRLFAKVDAVPRFLKDDTGFVDLVYRIDEDKPWDIRRVNVHIAAPGGYPHTRETVVHHKMLLLPGEPADPRLIELSRSRLRGGVFEPSGAGAPRIEIQRVSNEQPANRTARGQSVDYPPLTSQFRTAPRQHSQFRTNEFRTALQETKQNTQFRTAVQETKQNTQFRTAVQETKQNTHSLQFEEIPIDEVFGRAQGVPSINERIPAELPVLDDDEMAKSPNPMDTLGYIARGQNPSSIPNPSNPLFENDPYGDPYSGFESPYNRALRGQADLDVFVTEAQTGRLMFGVGVNSDAGLIGSFVLEENNFDITRWPTSWRDLSDGTALRGNGERFRAEAYPGEFVSRYSLMWQTSNFLDTDFSFGVSGFYYQRFLPGWDEERLGGRITLGYQINKWWSVTTAFRLESVELDNFATLTPLSLITEASGQNFLSSVRTAIAHDTRDSSFLPTSGHFFEAAFEQAFGDFVYPRLELQGTQHYTVHERLDGGGRHVLSVHGQVAWSDSGTPLFERYFAGGYQSFRGFSYRGVSPRAGGIRVGGDALVLASVQYSMPAPFAADDMVRLVAFTDVGTVEDTEDSLKLDRFRATVGFGLRLRIPAMGPAPLAFDFGFPVASEVSDDEQIFSFYIGVTR